MAAGLLHDHARYGQVAEWQTRTVQVRVSVRTWGFNSPLAHRESSYFVGLLVSLRMVCPTHVPPGGPKWLGSSTADAPTAASPTRSAGCLAAVVRQLV